MGAYLSEPIVEKETHAGENDFCRFGVAAMQGWRTSMEDAHAAEPVLAGGAPRAAFFGVYDGHGGREVARYCATRLHAALVAHPAYPAGRMQEALVGAFFAMDDQIRTEAGRRTLAGLAGTGGDAGGGAAAANLADDAADEDDGRGPNAGCTACCVLIQGGVAYCANAGDSRAVLSRRGVAVDLSTDHKPTLDGERARILAAGGFVADGRALSRAIGDMEFKQSADLGPEAQMVTALPDVRAEPLRAGDEFLLIACDGIWDVMTSGQACDFVRAKLAAGVAPEAAAAQLCDACCAPDTRGSGLGCDNMSVVVCAFKPTAFAEQRAST